MAGYADLAVVYEDLSLSANEPDDTPRIAKVAALNEALSRAFDDRVGRTWGTYVAETRVVKALGVSNMLIVDAPLATLTGVETYGTWNGTDWDDGIAVAPEQLRLVFDGRGIERVSGAYWVGPVRVTGTWADENDGDPPADVVSALTEAVTAAYRRETFNARDTSRSFDEVDASPPPSPLNGPLWKAAIATHTMRRLVVA